MFSILPTTIYKAKWTNYCLLGGYQVRNAKRVETWVLTTFSNEESGRTTVITFADFPTTLLFLLISFSFAFLVNIWSFMENNKYALRKLWTKNSIYPLTKWILRIPPLEAYRFTTASIQKANIETRSYVGMVIILECYKELDFSSWWRGNGDGKMEIVL